MSDNDGRSLAAPLTANDLTILRQTKQDLINAKAALDKAKKAGIDTTQQELDRVSALDKVEKLLAVYG